MRRKNIMIQVGEKSPYIIQGSVTAVDTDGTEIINEDMIALCHCGGSDNKPYYYRRHTNIGSKTWL